MSYRRMRRQDLWGIYRRRRAGQSLARISANEGRDRKTVRQYLHGLEELGLKEHGTTGIAPMEAFEQERTTLQSSANREFGPKLNALR